MSHRLIIRKLQERGVPRDQAEAHAEAANLYLFPQLATKADIGVLKSDISELKIATKAEISELKVWLVSVMVGIAGISLVIAKFT